METIPGKCYSEAVMDKESEYMQVDIRKVAELAKVSISTVSRVLNSSGYVSDATRTRVLAITKELGFRQNSIARSLRSKNSSFVGLLVPDITNEFFASLARAIEQNLHHLGFSLFLCNTMEDPEAESRYIESLLRNQVMGIVLVSVGLKRHPRIQRNDTPIVLVDRVESDTDISQMVIIESDNERGGALAAQELLKRGVQSFVFLGDERNMHHMRKREHGFQDTLLANGVPGSRYLKESVPVLSIKARDKIKDIYRAFPFDGIFCGTDTIAIGAMRGLEEMGLAIPASVQVVGFDGISIGEFTSPPLSTIRQDTDRMGKSAAENIVGMIKGAQGGETIVLPVDFLPRSSTAMFHD
jgi:DNA-binding LacI/PurR family transcriptional regulator